MLEPTEESLYRAFTDYIEEEEERDKEEMVLQNTIIKENEKVKIQKERQIENIKQSINNILSIVLYSLWTIVRFMFTSLNIMNYEKLKMNFNGGINTMSQNELNSSIYAALLCVIGNYPHTIICIIILILI